MKRINEKVKDIVDVRKFLSLQDFTADPTATLAAYHFTDATSELMTKWLDRLADVQHGQGHALALAGYRGVGKSHFLAVLAAIAGQPELRTRVADSHVAAGAQALLRRRYPSIFVRRGTQPTLLAELRHAVADAFSLERDSLPDGVFDLLSIVRTRAGDIPFLVLVDTSMERNSRVARDDGPMLAEIADTVKSMNAFIGIALDDDIAGADGSNAAIVRAYTIDYLDQEHLYKVVDTHVFPKNQQLRSVLKDVYEYFREVMPTFRWSEQRFTSLYPLHPAILDVAPFVRLYVHNFALLGFAAEAGERILGRPANSLIALDEVFDNAESELRKVEDLAEAFAAYDRLNSEVVAKIPVMQRLQAKLILKALLILSLEGQGTTAGDICSGTLIFDESDPKKANKTVEEIIRMFAAALPDEVKVFAEPGREVRYGLRVASKDTLNNALNEIAASVDPSVVDEIIHRAFHDRFHDSTFFSTDGSKRSSMECQLYWRGGLRRGRVVWNDGTTARSAAASVDEVHDWEVVIERKSGEIAPAGSGGDLPRAVWKAAELKPDEADVIKRFHVLHSDTAFREQNGDQLRGALQSHALLLDRIVNRLFIEDGLLAIDNFDYNLSEDARTSVSLSSVFATMLEPLFEARYPEHPYFLRNLGLSELSVLVADLYSGTRQKLSDVQQLAQTFALPLGLVKLADGVYYPSTQEQLLQLPSVRSIEKILDEGDGDRVDLSRIYAELRKPPFGIVREAQQLILTAMVSQRMIEFVTSKGDRINQRSLDLKIIWDDIVGLARPQESAFSAKKLAAWAAAITGDAEIKGLNTEAGEKQLRESLSKWLAEWDRDRVLSRFNDLPEESMNTRIWKMVGRASKTLGATASLIRKGLENTIPLEECLGRISEAFTDDPANVEKAKADLNGVRIYLDSFDKHSNVEQYLSLAESTGISSIERRRETVLAMIGEFGSSPSGTLESGIESHWVRFQQEFSDHYIARHDAVMVSPDLAAAADEVRKSDGWWVFENLSELFDPRNEAVSQVLSLKNEMARLNCEANTAEQLKTRPFCSCGYTFAHHKKWESVVERLRASLDVSVAMMFEKLAENSVPITTTIDALVQKEGGGQLAQAAGELAAGLRNGKPPAAWSIEHIQLLRAALSTDMSAGGPSDASSNAARMPLDEAAMFEDVVLSLK